MKPNKQKKHIKLFTTVKSGLKFKSDFLVNNSQVSTNFVSIEKEMATHSTILAWEIPWTEEPGQLQSTRL